MRCRPGGGRPGWLARRAWRLGGLRDDTGGRRRFVEELDRRAVEETRARCGMIEPVAGGRMSHLRRGWYWGSQAFAEKLLTLLSKAATPRTKSWDHQSAQEQKAHSEKVAEQMVRAGLSEAGLPESELDLLPGSDPRKVRLAQAVWEQTTVSMGWIAARLRMRSAANVSQILRRHRSGSPHLQQPPPR